MSPEEHQLLASLFDRVRSAGSTPRDGDADAFVNQAVREQPYAPYFLAQAVILQEQGLKSASERIQQLEARVRELEQAGTGQPPSGGGFLSGIGSLFGGAQQQPARSSVPPAGSTRQTSEGQLYDDYARNAPPQQQQQPMPQQPAGPWSGQQAAPSAGGSFLRGALTTAAGVAGGMMLADSLRGLFAPHLGGLAAGSPFGTATGTAGAPVEETVINNYYSNDGGNQDRDDNASSPVQQADFTDDDDSGYDDSSDDGSFDV